MFKSQGLFKRVARGLSRANSARKLYTDQIYPYPYKYFTEKVYPGQYCYRETFIQPPWHEREERMAKWLWRSFWTYWWYQMFSNPHVLTGHFNAPDPTKWTDEELGIPPPELGSYAEWKANRDSE